MGVGFFRVLFFGLFMNNGFLHTSDEHNNPVFIDVFVEKYSSLCLTSHLGDRLGQGGGEGEVESPTPPSPSPLWG